MKAGVAKLSRSMRSMMNTLNAAITPISMRLTMEWTSRWSVRKGTARTAATIVTAAHSCPPQRDGLRASHIGSGATDLAPEQAGGPRQQDDQHDHEQHQRARRAAEIDARIRLDEADDDCRDDRAGDAAEAAEDD